MDYNNMELLSIPLPEDLMKLKWNGYYDLVKEMIDIRLKKDIPEMLKQRLILEKEILNDISREFVYTKEEALKLLINNIEDFDEAEFDWLFKDNALEFMFVNGQIMFKGDILDNLVYTRENYNTRARKMNEDILPWYDDNTQLLDKVISKLEDQKELSYLIHVKLSIKIKEEYQKNKKMRAWLPIPIEYAQVEDFKILYTSDGLVEINNNDIAHRSAYYEIEDIQEASIEYQFINHVKYQELDPGLVTNDIVEGYLDEIPPHIVFTPYLKALVNDIIGNEENPLIKARKIYDYITSHVMYSYVRQYLTLPAISHYMATGFKGDCGLQATLFITMCRIAGIPASWQAGLYATPLTIGNHDWARFYIAPYGWLYADCSFGGSAYRKGSKLRHDFYFGHIEPFRIPSAQAFQGDLYPKNHYLRRDPYDHQTGEVEYIDGHINQDYYERNIEIKKIIELK
ncbi:MAG: transglutaminase-like domain-containing protein [Erysipelotrichaceae bacterium]|nr:transglutaminase-like domain-containing protein [Erysipelotrichaceae bacterium]